MKAEIEKRITFVEHSETKIGQIWTSADHAKLVRHLKAVDELATAMCRNRPRESMRPITVADFATLGLKTAPATSVPHGGPSGERSEREKTHA